MLQIKAPLFKTQLLVLCRRRWLLNGRGFSTLKKSEVLIVCNASGSLACIAFQRQPFEMQANIYNLTANEICISVMLIKRWRI